MSTSPNMPSSWHFWPLFVQNCLCFPVCHLTYGDFVLQDMPSYLYFQVFQHLTCMEGKDFSLLLLHSDEFPLDYYGADEAITSFHSLLFTCPSGE